LHLGHGDGRGKQHRKQRHRNFFEANPAQLFEFFSPLPTGSSITQLLCRDPPGIFPAISIGLFAALRKLPRKNGGFGNGVGEPGQAKNLNQCEAFHFSGYRCRPWNGD
jgi:hypothetical protein